MFFFKVCYIIVLFFAMEKHTHGVSDSFNHHFGLDNSGVYQAEYQVIVIVDFDDGRLFPMTEELPKCLLPVMNRPLLLYQLDLLKKSQAKG